METKAKKVARRLPAQDGPTMKSLMSMPNMDELIKHIKLGSHGAAKAAAADPIAYLADYLRQVVKRKDRKKGTR